MRISERILSTAVFGVGLGLAAAGAFACAAPAGAQPTDPMVGDTITTQSDKGAQSLNDAAYPFTRPNPEAEIGKLPNGLTYGVMRRAGTRKVTVMAFRSEADLQAAKDQAAQ